ncbi:hypothetical protein BJX70DRAFT_101128 [Aspergillus crustosus]
MWLLIGAVCAGLAMAHGDDESMDISASDSQDAHGDGPMSYFAYGQHSGTIVAHIALMVLAWCFVLPAAVLLSVGRSRLALPSQFLFLVLTAIGLLFGIVYDSQTPNLYENNAHHKIGWIVTWVFSAQVVLALIFAYAGRGEIQQAESAVGSESFNRVRFLPLATNEHECLYTDRASHDHESGPSTPSRASQTEFDGFEKPEEFHPKPSGLRVWYYNSSVHRILSKRVPGLVSTRALRILNGIYNIIDRIILPFGFIAIATGAITYGGLFHGIEVFNGVAHFIKGGIFFWYGILTLGRFIGAWADLGWAWNKKPPAAVVGWKAKVPSGEFVESFVIWLYGVTNVFLEHLSGWGGEWTAADLQHVSISVMFFGGGLVGMLVESRRVREVLNHTLLQSQSPSSDSEYDSHSGGDEIWQPPTSQKVPLNPMPALVILLLGMMMGSHHQDSMTSSMVHKQWGNLLVGFALSRGMTYFLLFLRPPTSYLPSRPPTEIVAGFCLIAGGLIFMLSARDVILAMEFYSLDAMFTFTVGMGFTAFIMALVVLAIALKAWAVRRERRWN